MGLFVCCVSGISAPHFFQSTLRDARPSNAIGSVVLAQPRDPDSMSRIDVVDPFN